MTAKEKLLLLLPGWTEEQAAIALRAVEPDALDESEMAPLPAGWGETLTGEPMANVVAAVRRSRDDSLTRIWPVSRRAGLCDAAMRPRPCGRRSLTR